MKVKVESEKLGLKLNIQKTKTMASGSITSWVDGETVETVSDFILGSQRVGWLSNWTELKGTFHAKMGTTMDRNNMDLTEAEDVWKDGKNTQNYTKKF